MIKIEILETTTQIKELLRSPEFIDVKERIQMIYWIKTRQVITTETIALLLGKHQTTISRWLDIYRDEGMGSLLSQTKTSDPNEIITAITEDLVNVEVEP